MEPIKTPLRNQLLSSKVNIPPSPLMKSLGYGTGVSVYKLDRSPSANQTPSPWAIKKISKHTANKNIVTQRLCDEASILKKLNHPNIVGFRAFTPDFDGKACLAMEACSSSLGNLIETRYENGLLAFEPKYILKVAVDIANALDYLHNDARILHCDIKSYNVLVKGNFEICKLCDFGVAVSMDTISKKCIGEETLHGTLAWMAPETVTDNIMTDKCDIYSYGLVIWEMLALVPPPLQEENNVTQDSELSIDYDSSFASESDISNNLNIRKIGSRPELPSQEFTGDYNYVLELFHCCTEEDPDLRPKASELVLVTKKIQKDWN